MFKLDIVKMRIKVVKLRIDLKIFAKNPCLLLSTTIVHFLSCFYQHFNGFVNCIAVTLPQPLFIRTTPSLDQKEKVT